MATRRLLACLALVLARASLAAADGTDAAGWMFDPSVVVRIDLVLSEEARAALVADPTTYVPATFTLAHGARRFGPWSVALKLKGSSSFRPLDGKAAFKLKFPSGARPDGLKKLTLNNMVQDASTVHEAVAYELFRAMDVCAPRTGYAVVTLNGAPYGLYLNVETLDSVSLARCYPETRHLYEGTDGFLNDPSDAFDAHYEVDEGDADDRDDLVALLGTASDLSPGWYARMAALADLDQMTRMWATEAYVGHWDGYTGRYVNNYYLHADGDGRFTMLPWGTDQTLTVRTPLVDRSAPHPLFDGCVRDPICGALYGDALAAVAARARDADLATRARAIESAIHTAIAADPKREHSTSDARRALAGTIRFLRARRADLSAWFATLPRAPRGTTVTAGAGAIVVQWKRPTGRPRAATRHAADYRRAAEPWTRVEAAPGATSCTIAGLDPGSYEVRLRRLADDEASTSAAASPVVVTP